MKEIKKTRALTNGMAVCGSVLMLTFGCQVQPPSGAVITPRNHGEVVDQINQLQEMNADAAKLIVYSHEFELNEQPHDEPQVPGPAISGFEYRPPKVVRGFRLGLDGQDHVRQIGLILSRYPVGQRPQITVERSQTSKAWNTKHHYPIHTNDELDRVRRQVVVGALMAMGIEDADELVVVAPAFPTGLNATEAAAAYQNSIDGSLSSGQGASFSRF